MTTERHPLPPDTRKPLCAIQLWQHWYRQPPTSPPRPFSPSSPLLAHCREHAFWCKRQGGDMRPYGIGHRIGDGCSRSDDGRLTYATRTVECVLRRHFDNDTFDIGHIQGTGDLVIQKTSIDVASRLWVEHHLLCQAVAQGLRGSSLHLPFN